MKKKNLCYLYRRLESEKYVFKHAIPVHIYSECSIDVFQTKTRKRKAEGKQVS